MTTQSSVGGALMVLSFTATTVGYGGAACYVAHAIIHTRQEELLMLPYVVGIVLSIGVASFARWVGFDRDRAFYPAVLSWLRRTTCCLRR
jgi:hypothetical protein